MKKLLMTLAMTFVLSNAFAKENALYSQPYVPTLEIPNLISVTAKGDTRYSGKQLINPNRILYMVGYNNITTLYFMSAINKQNSLIINGSVDQALYEFSKNKCYEKKPECTNKDNKFISLYKTPIFISIEAVGVYYGMLSININNIEYIAFNSNSQLVEIILSPYTVIPTKLSMDELNAIIYGATH